jgi:phosphatidylglycerophosphate synthase
MGTLVYEFNFILDTADGKLERLGGRHSTTGAFLDIYLDSVRVFINLLALVFGQYQLSGEIKYLLIGICYLFYSYDTDSF